MGRSPMPEADENRIVEGGAPGKRLEPAAQRALEEAQARRKAMDDPKKKRELNGRDGPDPVRYGDWEVKGLATDF